jgi:hypothetical protein
MNNIFLKFGSLASACRQWMESKHLGILPALMSVLVMNPGTVFATRTSYISDNIGLTVNSSGNATGLTNRLTGANWLAAASSIYNLSGGAGLTKTVSFMPLTNGEIQVTLTLTNPTSTNISAAPTFPILSGLYPGTNYGTLTYCFPQMGRVSETAAGFSGRYYGGGFPMQFMDVYDGTAGGIYVMTHDLSNSFREYEINVTSNSMQFAVVYDSQVIGPGDRWVLNYVIGAHTGDWHAALNAYRNWVATWYAPLVPRQSWFQDVYNFRELFLYTNTAIGDTPAYNPATQTYSFNTLLAGDLTAFGGDDYVHLFDWSQTPANGRVGDYNPWDYLGGVPAFSNQIAQIQASNIPVGLYFEGYLIATNSAVGQAYGSAWQLLNSSLAPYTTMGANYYCPCPQVAAWTNYLTRRCLTAVSNCAASGVYIDEFGFGWQYRCYDSDHGHVVPSQQVQAEGAMMKQIRTALPAATVLYSEERGADVNSQYQDGSFTYSISQSSNNPSRLNLARFALPDYKVFEILDVDTPIGNNPQLYASVFFNGEGFWLEGPATNTAWFPPNICSLIAKEHGILRRYADAFRSTNPVPLVATLDANIYANEFPGTNHIVWTLYNAGAQTVTGELLAVPYNSSSTYYDAWNGQVLTPRISGTNAYLTLSIASGNAGCIVQQAQNYFSAVLDDNPAGYWRLDEPDTAPGAVSTNCGSLGAALNGTYYGSNATAYVVANCPGAIAGDSDAACGFSSSSTTRSNMIVVPYNAAALGGSRFSFEVWARPLATNTSGNYRAVLRCGSNSPQQGFILYQNNASWQFWMGTNGSGWYTVSANSATTNWNHLVGTFDGTNLSCYVNGTVVRVAVLKSYACNLSGPLMIGMGGTPAAPSYPFATNIDEVAIYTNALSPDQVLYHYVAGSGSNPPVTLAPSIYLFSPQFQTNNTGASATAQVTAGGSLPLQYQWTFSTATNNGPGTPVTGATNATLVIDNLALTNQGAYWVIITNSLGACTNPVPAWVQVVDVSTPVISISQSGQSLALNWSGGVLQQSSNLLDARWSDMTNAVSPLDPAALANSSSSQMFYRVKK